MIIPWKKEGKQYSATVGEKTVVIHMPYFGPPKMHINKGMPCTIVVRDQFGTKTYRYGSVRTANNQARRVLSPPVPNPEIKHAHRRKKDTTR